MKRSFSMRVVGVLPRWLCFFSLLVWAGGFSSESRADLLFGMAAPGGEVDAREIENGTIFLEPVIPTFSIPDGWSLEMRVNGESFDGEPISGQGLHKLVLEAVPLDGGESRVMEREFIVLDPEASAPHHTMALEAELVRRMRESPHVRPTLSADEHLVIGQSRGWEADPEIPPHDLHGFQITDPDVPDSRKVRVVLADGNHPREHTGSWGLRGILAFLTSEEPEARALRRLAIFYVYPIVNPDGRYLARNRNNPELAVEDERDHNRVWNTTGRFSTIDAFTNAMRADTGGTADVLLDFHSAGATFFYSLPEMMDTPLARAISARDPSVQARASSGHPGMLRIWAMSEEGLSAKWAYTPEFRSSETAKRSIEIGRGYGLALYDLLSGRSSLAAADELLALGRPDGFGLRQRQELNRSRARMLAISRQSHGRRVWDELDRFFEAVDGYRAVLDMRETAELLAALAGDIRENGERDFRYLHARAVRREGERVATLLGRATASAGDLSAATENLSSAINAYWKSREVETAPMVRTLRLAGSPAVYAPGVSEEWENGFLVNTAVANGRLGLAEHAVLSFDGDGNHLATTFVPGESTLGDRFTWEFWKNYRSFGEDTGSSGVDGSSPRFYTQFDDDEGTLRVALGNAWWGTVSVGETDVWHHVAVVFDQGEVRTFLNGQLAHTRSGVVFSGDAGEPYAIGRGFRNARWLDGLSHGHRIWNTALGETDIRLNRHRPLTGEEAGLVAWWKMNEGSGDTVRDHGPGGHHAEIHGASWVRYGRPGFRLSQPIHFTDIRGVGESRISWQTDVDGAEEAVSVWIGISRSDRDLPREWRRAENGGEVPFLANGTNLTDRRLWVKQRIETGTEGATPPRLHEFRLMVR